MKAYSNVSRIYDPNTGEVHCDWRLAITDCVEADAIRWIYIANLIISSLLSVLGVWLLIHRFMQNGFSLINVNGAGFLRPRPIESFITCLLIFHFGYIATDVIMLMDAFPNYLVNELVWELPWPAAFSAVTLYVVGIIGNTPSMNPGNVQNKWLPSTTMVDVNGSILVFCPMFFIYVFSILAGYFTDIGNDTLAILFIRAHYGCWAVWCTFLLSLNAYFGWKLTSLIDKHLSEFTNQYAGTGMTALKTGLIKLRIVLMEIAIALFFFTVAMILYAIFRNQILISSSISIVFGSLWILIVPCLTFIGFIVITIRPLEDYASIYRRSSGPRMSIAKENHRPSIASQYHPEHFPPLPTRASYASKNSNSKLFEGLNESWTQLDELEENDMTEEVSRNEPTGLVAKEVV